MSLAREVHPVIPTAKKQPIWVALWLLRTPRDPNGEEATPSWPMCAAGDPSRQEEASAPLNVAVGIIHCTWPVERRP